MVRILGKSGYISLLSTVLFAICIFSGSVSGGESQSEILGPGTISPGDLSVFEIAEPAEWCLTPVEKTIGKWAVDSSGKSLYFASTETGSYTICAAVLVEGKPKLFTKTFIVSGDPGPKPQPKPEPEPQPEPQPDDLTTLVRQKCEEMSREEDSERFAREKQSVLACFQGIEQSLQRGSLRTTAAARANLRQSLSSKMNTFPNRSKKAWTELNEEISRSMEKRSETAPDDLALYKTLLREIISGLETKE